MDTTTKPDLQLPPNIAHICVEGVIGVGKTSLCTLLADRFNGRKLMEKVEENPFLQKFYKNRKALAFQTQLWFLLSRYKQLSEETVQQDLFQGLVVADYMFAKDRIFAGINLTEDELPLYDTVARILERQIPRPDVVIYLQASTEVLLKRVEMRGRMYESSMEREYLETLNEAYNHFFFHYSDAPVLVVNTNELDFVNNTVDFEEIIRQIVQTRHGINYYQPMNAHDRLRLEENDRRKRQRPSDAEA
jgi:deoxyadenosine/deoxycytidine kinase